MRTQIRISPETYEFLRNDIENAKKLNLNITNVILTYIFRPGSKDNILLSFCDQNDDSCEDISTKNNKRLNVNLDLILPIHPLPKNEKSLGEWIDSLAKANLISFKSMFFYILKLSNKNGFKKTLKDLTSISEKKISRLDNDLKYKFLNDKLNCPVCNYKLKSRDYIFTHINLVHNLGSENIKCPYCNYLAQNKPKLHSHLRKNHPLHYFLKIKS